MDIKWCLRKLQNILPRYILRSIYFSLIDSHLNYGLSVWGSACKYNIKPLIISQKKAIRIICGKPYNHPTDELFKELNILKLNSMYKLSLGKLMYNVIPISLSEMFTLNHNVHHYNTRNSAGPHLFARHSAIYCKSFIMEAPKFWLHLTPEIKSCNNIGLFNKRVRQFLINKQ